MSGASGRRGVLLAVGVVALVFGPFATYQLTLSARRGPPRCCSPTSPSAGR